MKRELMVGEALDQIGYGRFQKKLLWICGASWAADAMEVLLIGFAIPSLMSAWSLTKAQSGQLASVLFLGMLIGAWFWGTISDRIGRKLGFMATIGIDSLFGLLSALSPNFIVLMIFRFITGFGVGGTLPVDYSIFGEYLPSKNRGRHLVILESFWALGTIVAAGLAWIIVPQLPNVGWRILLAASAVPGLIVFFIRRSIPESPRNLMARGKVDEAKAVVNMVAAYNKVDLGEFDLRAEPLQKEVSATTIFRSPLLKQTITMTVAWFFLSLAYYGMFTWLPGIFKGQGFTFYSTYQYTFIVALAQVPGYFSAAWLVEKWGRVKTTAVYLVCAAVATYLFAVSGSETTAVICSAFMSFFSLGAWGCLYAYTPELYPTTIRGTGMGWASGIARLSGFVAPMLGAKLLDVNLVLALTVYAASFAVAGITVFILGKETKDTRLA
jgi:putative MFS transporter